MSHALSLRLLRNKGQVDISQLIHIFNIRIILCQSANNFNTFIFNDECSVQGKCTRKMYFMMYYLL